MIELKSRESEELEQKEELLRLKNNFELSCSEIESLPINSEPYFIYLGKELTNISKHANVISDIALNLTELLFGDENSNANSLVQLKLKTLDECLSDHLIKLWASKAIMVEIEEKFNQLYEPTLKFKKIIKRLNLHAISTKIESAQLTNKNNSFNSLAENVNELVDNSENNFKELTTSVDIIIQQIQLVFKQTEKLINENYHQCKAKLDPVKKSLKDLLTKQENFADTTEQISTDMKKNIMNINSIVESLQIHDIVRQKIEHIVLVTNNFANDEIFKNLSIDYADYQEKCIYIGAFSNIQTEQLAIVKGEVSEAIYLAMDKLSSILENTTDINSQTDSIVGSVKNITSSILKDTTNQIDDINKSLIATVKISTEISTAIESIIDKVNRTMKFVDEINESGSNIELVAFNGLVHASKMGNEGATIRVIADSIQKVSEEALSNINEFTLILKDVGLITKQISLGDEIQAEENNLGIIINDVSSEINNFFKRISRMNIEIEQKVDLLKKASKKISSDINDISSKCTVTELFDKHITNAISKFDEIITSVSKFGKMDKSAACKKQLDEIQKIYTVQSEHNVYNDYFENQSCNKFQPSNTNDYVFDDVSDDNIELF